MQEKKTPAKSFDLGLSFNKADKNAWMALYLLGCSFVGICFIISSFCHITFHHRKEVSSMSGTAGHSVFNTL